jgi:hypothetical protein
MLRDARERLGWIAECISPEDQLWAAQVMVEALCPRDGTPALRFSESPEMLWDRGKE